ncbi:MAG: hypothetical protein IPH05_08040 [Flavobacteriales bacterium]|nr:hypothetical protein [Flavobacteriales bacterium]
MEQCDFDTDVRYEWTCCAFTFQCVHPVTIPIATLRQSSYTVVATNPNGLRIDGQFAVLR